MMGNYSKLIGALVGGIIGLLVNQFGMPADLGTPAVQSAIVVILSAAATYLFPANKK